jgi:hypothetical protein
MLGRPPLIHIGCMAMAIVEANFIPEGLAFDDVLLAPGP